MSIRIVLTGAESVVSIASEDPYIIPAMSQGNIVITVTTMDSLIVRLISVSSIDSVIISPEVLVEGIWTVLVISVDVLIA